MNPELNTDQDNAWESIIEWMETDNSYYILGGYAGTGKSYLLGLLAKYDFKKIENVSNVYFSATTNKAAKVLSNLIESEAKTIYSLLGLRMIESDDKLVLTPAEETPYFPRGTVIVVDEASMIGTELLSAIDNAVRYLGTRFIFVGDPAQLPPVGEKVSPVWKIPVGDGCMSILRQVMRNDNQLLKMATDIRSSIAKKEKVYIVNDNKNDLGIFLLKNQSEFENALLSDVDNIDFSKTKVIAWRNKTVDYYNDRVREALGHKTPYCRGETILMAQPVIKEKVILANVDDEFTIRKRTGTTIFFDDMPLDVWLLEVYDKNQSFLLHVSRDKAALNSLLAGKAAYAKAQHGHVKKSAWASFWELKNMFNDVRYGYALTAHRSQGSTLECCYVDQQDILCNQNTQESLRCLYVAVTRPTTRLYTY